MDEATKIEQLATDRYLVQERLGAGGMGTVHRAIDRLTGEAVALKQVLTPVDQLRFNALLSQPSSDPRLALAHEFQTLASLRHPNVISVKDYGFTRDGRAYFTMTLLEKPQTILQAAQGRSLDYQLNLLLQTLQALAYIHRRGLLHRDLKPSNVMVVDDVVYVVDFGLATEISPDRGPAANIAGTLAYMPPEVLAGDQPDPRADLYALGVIAYEMISGAHPFHAPSATDLITNIMNREPDIAALDVPVDLANTLRRLMDKQPENRFSNALDTLSAMAAAGGLALPPETIAIRESFIQAATFIGREAELARLTTALEGMREHGTGGGWLIGGESGVGKSRLINEVATRAMVGGALVLRGQAVTEGGVAYQLWRNALRRLALNISLSTDEAAALRVAVPDIGDFTGGTLPPEDEFASGEAHTRLNLTFDSIFRRAAAQQPILVVLEDLQWTVDLTSDVELINTLIRVGATAPVMVIGTYRDDERGNLPDQFPEAAAIRLQRLNDQEIARLTASMLGQVGRRSPVVDLLKKETEGNVFFIVEVVRALAEDAGRIADIGQATLPTQMFTGGVRRIVQYRLDRVPEWARPLVDIAAVAGRQIDVRIIQALDPALNVEQWLTVCTDVAVFAVSGSVYQFAHDKLREGVLDALDAATLRQYHLKVAQVIEQVYADDVNAWAAVLAHHYDAAEAIEPASRYLMIAARQAKAINNHRDAYSLYSRALELNAHQYTDDPDRTLADLRLGLGTSAYSLSDYETARNWCKQALADYVALGEEFGVSNAINCLGECDFRQGLFEQAGERIKQALEIRRRLDRHRDVGYCLMNLGVIEAQSGSLTRALELFTECHEIMKDQDEPIALARALNNLAIAYDLTGDKARAAQTYEESLAIRRRINDKPGIAYSLLNIGALAETEGDLEKARAHMTESLELVVQVGDRNAQAAASSALASVLRKLNAFNEAEAYEKEALIIRRKIGDRQGIAISFNGLALIALHRADYESGWGYVRQGLTGAVENALQQQMAALLLTAARLHRDQGELTSTARILAVLDASLPADTFQRANLDEMLAEFPADVLAAVGTGGLSLKELARRYIETDYTLR
ncbi:MAG: ATP-binding protein [Chloroflexota bacterium]